MAAIEISGITFSPITHETKNMAETVISVGVSCNHFEFRVNQQTKGFFIVIIVGGHFENGVM